jgi:hypothetical protein
VVVAAPDRSGRPTLVAGAPFHGTP